jgi:hypothetical protein
MDDVMLDAWIMRAHYAVADALRTCATAAELGQQAREILNDVRTQRRRSAVPTDRRLSVHPFDGPTEGDNRKY